MGMVSGVRNSARKLAKRIVNRASSYLFFAFVALPLFIAGDTTEIYDVQPHQAWIVIHFQRLRRGARQATLIVLRFPGHHVVDMVFNAYARLLAACTTGVRTLRSITGYQSFVDPVLAQIPCQLLPGFEAMLHPELEWYNLPQMLRTALPGSNALVNTTPSRKLQGFWGSRDWKVVSEFERETFAWPADFRLVGDLGSGSFGDVVKVKGCGTTLAVKRISKHGLINSRPDLPPVRFGADVVQTVWSEIYVHICMDEHPAFPSIFGVWHGPDYFYVAMECGVECFVDIVEHKRDKALFYGMQLILALHALHKEGIVHLDVKPDNLLRSKKGNLLLIDYGVSQSFESLGRPPRVQWPLWHNLKDTGTDAFPMLWPGPDNPHSWVVGSGTPRYQSPPLKRVEPVSYGTDIWAMGMVIYICLTGRPPTFKDLEWDQIRLPHQSSIEHDFFVRIFSYEKPHRFESYAEIKAHPIWKTSPWTWAQVESNWRKRRRGKRDVTSRYYWGSSSGTFFRAGCLVRPGGLGGTPFKTRLATGLLPHLRPRPIRRLSWCSRSVLASLGP
ncbi:kinase-like domain-containing protein [Mycena maculata]|uniref:non-specific serine/threonine protein kinase n=1 Tax=Mycena maculata TaxID=230809 RepID=A0AAD7JF84_9AGAR|nr:kinase-like domain-containing protein [Mycena maculata]